MVLFHLYLWIAPYVLLGLCLILSLSKRLQGRHPVFVGYIAAEAALFLVTAAADLLFVRHFLSLGFFQWIVVTATGVLSIFQLWVLYEVAGDLLLSHSSMKAVLRPLMRWTAVTLLLVAAAASALLAQPGLRRVMAAFQTLDFLSSVIEVGLLLILLAFTRALHISWRNLSPGIALGLGVSASIEIAASALLSAPGHGQYLNLRIDSLRLSGFHLCVVIWLVYILLPDNRALAYKGKTLKAADLDLWNEQMQNIRR